MHTHASNHTLSFYFSALQKQTLKLFLIPSTLTYAHTCINELLKLPICCFKFIAFPWTTKNTNLLSYLKKKKQKTHRHRQTYAQYSQSCFVLHFIAVRLVNSNMVASYTDWIRDALSHCSTVLRIEFCVILNQELLHETLR